MTMDDGNKAGMGRHPSPEAKDKMVKARKQFWAGRECDRPRDAEGKLAMCTSYYAQPA